MSEKQEHRARIRARLDYLHRLTAWLDREPPAWRIAKHRKWRREKPVLEVAA